MKIIKSPAAPQISELCKRPGIDCFNLIDSVRAICDLVRTEGDLALFKFTQEFDGVTLSDLLVTDNEINEAQVSEALMCAIEVSIQNIRAFHQTQIGFDITFETSPGISCSRRAVPIEKVGLYIPGGTAPLISTLLMLAVPAQIAGCTEIIICTPPLKDGTVSPGILVAAKLLGIKKIYKVGGAQAIAGMAFGTQTIPKVYKIFGPGNQYVTAAKNYVSLLGTAIDLPAGPSEVAIIADENANPRWIAADLLSQAEHGKDSQVLLVTTSENILTQVQLQLAEQLELLPRALLATESLKNSSAVLVQSLDEAIQIANEYAPEHLILAVAEPQSLANKVKNAGSVFLGNFTPESLGDYSSGTNHVLPTNGGAKAFAGVSLDSFVKKITYQTATKAGLQNLGRHVVELARAEGLEGHAQAILKRVRI